MVFLTVLLLDLSGNCALGLMNYFGIERFNTDLKLWTVTDEDWVILGVSGLCGIILLFVLPIWYVQFSNLLMNKTTHQKYAYRKNGVFSSLSSTSSILLRDSEDWTYYSKNSNDFIDSKAEKSCCSSSKPEQRISESSNINEEIE